MGALIETANGSLLVPLGDDGLPISSPVLPSRYILYPHLHREDWRTTGRFLDFHLVAEQFRRRLVERGLWRCRGFNCHDCVERRENIDQIVSCSIDTPLAEFTFSEDHFQLAWHLRPYLRRILDTGVPL